jgi:hypothetical protein
MAHDPHLVTLLTGEEKYYSARKTFRPGPPGGPPTLVDDYLMGRVFCWHQERLSPGAELMSWAELLRRLADQPRTLHVHASVRPWVPPGEKIERNDDFMEEPAAGVHLVHLDVDGWESSHPWWEGPEALRAAVHEGLHERGLGELAALDCVCMLSQGAWPGGVLKAHIYYWSDEALTLDALRTWAALVNARVGGKAIDGAVMRAVQPDYTARRACTGGLVDPIAPADRVHLLAASSTAREQWPDVTFASVVGAEIGEAEASGRRRAVDRSRIEKLKGDGWTLLDRMGTDDELNDYGYVAAARIVRQEGKAHVMANLRELATRMHQIAWQGIDGLGGIVVNSGGTRGGTKDMQTYVVSRFEQYLKSACDRSIGDEPDRLAGVVQDSLATGVETLFSQVVLEAAAKLQHRWPGHFERLREDIRKSAGIRIAVWQKMVDQASREQRKARRIDQAEALGALSVDRMDNLPDIVGDGGLNEIAFCNAIMETFDWLSDGDTTVFIDLKAADCEARGGYWQLGADSLANALRKRGMEIVASLGLSSSPEWTVKRVSELIAFDLDRRRALSVHRRAGSRRWGERVIATRYHRSRPPGCGPLGVVWINLGLEGGSGGQAALVESAASDERFTCLRCDEHGVTRMTWLEALQNYPDAPVWGTPQFDLGVGANDAIGVDKLVALAGDTETGQGLRETLLSGWLSKLFTLIRLRDIDEETYVLTWLVAVILDWDTKFILQLVGTQGSGKSSAADVLCALVDPKSHERRLETATGLRLGADSLNSEKLGFHLKGRATAVIDNLSSLTGPQQDRLCTVATGVCYSERILYTNIRLDHRISTSLILVGLYNFVTRPDLADRTYTIHIEKEPQWDDPNLSPSAGGVGDLSSRLEGCREEIISGLIKLAMAVKRYLGTHGELLSRRDGLYRAVNHVYWGSRASYMIEANRKEINTTILSGDSFALCFIAWLQHDHISWGPGGLLEGKDLTTSELLEHYKRWFLGPAHGKSMNVLTQDGSFIPIQIMDRRNDLRSCLPTDGRALGRKLTRLADTLSDYVSISRVKYNGTRKLILETLDTNTI